MTTSDRTAIYCPHCGRLMERFSKFLKNNFRCENCRLIAYVIYREAQTIRTKGQAEALRTPPTPEDVGFCTGDLL